MINREKELSFRNLISALDHMSCCVEEECNCNHSGKNHYEVIHVHNDSSEVIFEFPKEDKDQYKIADLQPMLKKFFSSADTPSEDYLHDFTNSMHMVEDLQNKHFTIVEGNDNVLDLIKHADLSEYSLMYCQNCKSLQHTTVQGTDGVLLFICDECDQIITEVYRVEEQYNFA
jgi:hypothetical protein